MNKHHRRFSSVLIATVAVAGLALTTACGGDDESTPAPKGETTTAASPEANEPEPQGRSERDDLVRFELEDRSQAGITNIWVVWTIKNNSSEKSTYSWDWEAVDAQGTRVANSSQLETDVQPGQTATGEFPTTLKTTEGIKLNITSFNRTAGF
ncbi:hypothetical protein ACFY78_30350 [Streptomyces olindensis]|uniref:hypothetical protein n=1 Tax=Streptomyces olindensis TaxID=358823 RepID=UPI0036A99D3C